MSIMGCSGRIFLSVIAVYGCSVAGLSRAAVTPQIGQNFTGSTFGPDSDASPADADGAVGPNYFVELINGRFSVYDKTTGTRVLTMTDLQFFRAAGLSFSSTVGVSDPRMIFDTYSQRWFASMIDVSINSRNQRSNHFLLAVSSTSDPTGKWSAFSFAADPNNANFADFPTLGLDQNGVYLSGDMFDRLGNSVGPTLVSIPKSSLLASVPSLAGQTSFGTLSYGARGDILQPAVTIGAATSSEIVVAAGDLGIDFQPHTTFFLSSILNGATTNATLSSQAVVLTVPSYTVPIDPSQPDGSSNLDNGDARLSACARRVGDILYATHAVEVDNRAAVRWYRINATNNTLIEAGTITDPTLDLFYPSIAANEAGTVVIGCNGSSGSTFVSSYASVGATTNGTLTFGPLTLLKSGTASYQNTDPSGTSRWGDYSATTVDPTDPNRFWTIQMIGVSASAWATQITEIITGGATSTGPRLAISPSANDLLISWPASTNSFQLQSSSSLGTTANWTPVTPAPTITNSVDSVLVPISTNAEFFRLTSGAAAQGSP